MFGDSPIQSAAAKGGGKPIVEVYSCPNGTKFTWSGTKPSAALIAARCGGKIPGESGGGTTVYRTNGPKTGNSTSGTGVTSGIVSEAEAFWSAHPFIVIALIALAFWFFSGHKGR